MSDLRAKLNSQDFIRLAANDHLHDDIIRLVETELTGLRSQHAAEMALLVKKAADIVALKSEECTRARAAHKLHDAEMKGHLRYTLQHFSGICCKTYADNEDYDDMTHEADCPWKAAQEAAK